jgi:hypothetical protein
MELVWGAILIKKHLLQQETSSEQQLSGYGKTKNDFLSEKHHRHKTHMTEQGSRVPGALKKPKDQFKVGLTFHKQEITRYGEKGKG